MTRREFMSLAGVVSAAGMSLHGMGQTVVPRRTVQADRALKYPGTVVPMGDIRMRSKWSG